MGDSTFNYKTWIHDAITEFQQMTKRGELERNLRLKLISEVTEEYFSKVGEWPDSVTLERLADLCLYEELSDPSLTKMQDEEYPIMSERQFDRRQSAEVSSGNRMDNNATDGQKHASPLRRNRSDYENRFVDKKAKIRNKERKKTYHEFTQVQPVNTSFLDR